MTENQNQKFNHNWELNRTLFGKNDWKNEPDFAYYIQAEIPEAAAQKIHHNTKAFLENHVAAAPQILKPEDYYLTITLPGRLGTHFQKNDIPFMSQTLKDICKSTEQIVIEAQNINCFPTSCFTEVYDPSTRLQQLHETLCNEIPFSQHPEFRYKNYLPHITLAHGGQPLDWEQSELARKTESVEIEITQLSLGKIKWQQEQLIKETIDQFNLQ